MAEPTRVDIAVVGGGLVGLSCAHMLCRALPEARIRLIEQHPPGPVSTPASSNFDARSTALSMGSVDMLQALGLWSQICDRAAPILNVQVSDRGHIGRVSYSEGAGERQPLGFVVTNAVLVEALNQTSGYPNLNLARPLGVEKVLPRQRAVQLSLSNGGSLQTSLLVIADGANSQLRRQLGIGATADDYHQHAVVANVAFEQPHQGRAFERFTAEGPMALLPLADPAGEGNTAALIWTRPDRELAACLAWSEQQFLSQLQQVFGSAVGRFKRVGKRDHYPLRRVLSEEQVRSNIVLLGNAVHSLHPVAGQGFNLALRDVQQLVGVLAEKAPGLNYGDLVLLQEYAERQQADQNRTSLISHGFNSIFSSEKKNLQLIRNLGLLSLELLPFAKQGFFAHMMGRGQSQVQPEFMRIARCGVQGE